MTECTNASTTTKSAALSSIPNSWCNPEALYGIMIPASAGKSQASTRQAESSMRSDYDHQYSFRVMASETDVSAVAWLKTCSPAPDTAIKIEVKDDHWWFVIGRTRLTANWRLGAHRSYQDNEVLAHVSSFTSYVHLTSLSSFGHLRLC